MGGGGNEWSWGLYDIDFVAQERRGGRKVKLCIMHHSGLE